ncbi:MAG: STAS domain-containing protein [Terracidiphilus sp.]
MASYCLNRRDKEGKEKRVRAAKPSVELNLRHTLINVERSGDWMPAEELREAALDALSQGSDINLNLDKIDHLDASALQILLALDAEQKKRERDLRLENASPRLRKWFEFAGVADQFFHGRGKER